jgi:hypothetical protein
LKTTLTLARNEAVENATNARLNAQATAHHAHHVLKPGHR